jgi:hypothetical protein
MAAHQKSMTIFRLPTLQVALVIRGLFICEFAYSHGKKGQKDNLPVKNGLFTFYLKIQDSGS